MLTACGGNSRQKTTAGVPDMHNAENALDYQGTYKGVFPAADCPGIEIPAHVRPPVEEGAPGVDPRLQALGELKGKLPVNKAR